MHDDTGAHRAPDGSSLSIMPAATASRSTQSRAPGPDQPSAAQPQPPGHTRSGGARPRVPGHDRPRAAPLAPGSQHPRHAQMAPGPDQPPVPQSAAPGQDRPRAAPRVPGQPRPHPAQMVPDHDEAPADVARVAGPDRPRAVLAAASRPDYSHVMPPLPGHDHSGHTPDAGAPPASVTHPAPPDQGMYDWSFAAHERQRLEHAADAPLLDAEVRLLQVLIQRFLATTHRQAPPRGRRRRGALARQREQERLAAQITLIGRAIDVLRRTLSARQALEPDTPSELLQLLDEAAKYMDAPAHPDDPAAPMDDPAAPIAYSPVLDAAAAPMDAPAHPDDPAAQHAGKEYGPWTIPN